MKELKKKFFEHAVMRLYLHGERVKAHKEQVKDVSVPNEEERARKRTRATTKEVVGRN